MSDEDEAANRIKSFEKWLDDAWGKSGWLGKLFIVTLLLGIGSPFILGVVEVLVVWYWILPIAATTTEKILAFGVLFSLLTALSLKVSGFANQILVNAYITRKRRQTKV